MTRIYTHIAIAALFFALAAGGYALAYLEVGKMGRRIAELDASLIAKRGELRSIQDARSALAAFEEKERNIRGYFVPSSEVVPFLGQIGSVGEALGTTAEVLTVAEGKDEANRNIVRVSLNITGNFAAVMRTVGALEYSPVDITLEGLSLDAVSREEGGGAWSAQATYQIGTRTP